MRGRDRRRVGARLAVAALGLMLGSAAPGQEAGGVWERLGSAVQAQGARLAEGLRRQATQEQADSELERDLAHSRERRQLYREVELLTELDRAEIHDRLERWECRVAALKQEEAQQRAAEWVAFGERLEAVCAGVGSDEVAQQQVCAEQRAAVSRALDEFDALVRRYAAECVPGVTP